MCFLVPPVPFPMTSRLKSRSRAGRRERPTAPCDSITWGGDLCLDGAPAMDPLAAHRLHGQRETLNVKLSPPPANNPQMGEVAAEAVEFPDDEHVVVPECPQAAVEPRPVVAEAGSGSRGRG